MTTNRHSLIANLKSRIPRSALVIAGLTSCAGDTTTTAERATVEYIAHAAFRIRSPAGNQVLIDPYASRVWLGYDFPGPLETDAVLITHPHYDHDAGDYRGHPFPWGPDVPVLREPGTYTVGDITLHGVRGKHADPYGTEFGQINTIWVVDVAGIRIVHWGDNGPITDQIARDLGRVDMLMLPIDAEYHILAKQDIENIRATLQPSWLVPMHYRIPELEPGDGPDDLGPIDPWLAEQSNVNGTGESVQTFSIENLPNVERVVVFRHSPLVVKPEL